MLTSNLSSGYHRDLQLLKPIVFDAFKELEACIDILLFMLNGIRVRHPRFRVHALRLNYSPYAANETGLSSRSVA